MYTKEYKKQKGFTLIELLLYLSIATVMLAVLGAIGINVLHSRVKAHSFEQVHYTGVYLSEVLKQKIKSAESLEVTSLTSLTLSMEDEAVDPTLISLVEGVVYIQEGESEPVAISSEDVSITQLDFYAVGTSTQSEYVSAKMRIQSVNLNDTAIYAADSTFYITAHTQ